MRMKTEKKEGGQPGNKNAEKWTEHRAIELGEELIAWMRPSINEKGRDVNAANIFVQDFLVIHKGLYKDLLEYLAEKYESFSDLKKTAKEIQEAKLWKYGTANKLNPTLTIFALKNFHNASDKIQHEITAVLPVQTTFSVRK